MVSTGRPMGGLGNRGWALLLDSVTVFMMCLLWLYLMSNQALYAPIFLYFLTVSSVNCLDIPIYLHTFYQNNAAFCTNTHAFYMV